jgi:hypothetical protein
MVREVCVLCGGRGTRGKRDGTFKSGRTPERAKCDGCGGAGSLPRARLRRLVRAGLRSEQIRSAFAALPPDWRG